MELLKTVEAGGRYSNQCLFNFTFGMQHHRSFQPSKWSWQSIRTSLQQYTISNVDNILWPYLRSSHILWFHVTNKLSWHFTKDAWETKTHHILEATAARLWSSIRWAWTHPLIRNQWAHQAVYTSTSGESPEGWNTCTFPQVITLMSVMCSLTHLYGLSSYL